MRLSGEKRERFLEVLGQTGNRRTAAEAIGVEPRLMDQRREFDPLLDRQWKEALDQADRRLSGASGPLDCIGGAEPMAIRRGSDGRMKIVKAGTKRWNRKVEDRFFAALAATGNIAASARAVGFSDTCIAQRRRQWPDFARRFEEALEDAEISLEFRLAVQGDSGAGERPSTSLGTSEGCGSGKSGRPSTLRPGSGQALRQSSGQASLGTSGGEANSANAEKFDPEFALRFLRWREEKRKGRGQRGRTPAPPSIEDVTEKLMRRIEAIKRHRAREAGAPSSGEGS
jgi:hypothetical protein